MNVRQLLLAACLSCGQGFAREKPAIPKLECPGYLRSCIDPVFGNTITRITGKAGSPIAAIDARRFCQPHLHAQHVAAGLGLCHLPDALKGLAAVLR